MLQAAGKWKYFCNSLKIVQNKLQSWIAHALFKLSQHAFVFVKKYQNFDFQFHMYCTWTTLGVCVCFLLEVVVVVKEENNFQDKLKLYGKSICALLIRGIRVSFMKGSLKYFIFCFVAANI